MGQSRPGRARAKSGHVRYAALAILTPPAQARQTERARTQFDCTTTKVIMTNKAGQKGLVQVEEHMTFWIDDAAKTFIFSDGRQLRVTRFDKSWISANSEDIQYEFNRVDGSLTYAGSMTKDNVTTTIVGSGRVDVVLLLLRQLLYW